MLGVTAFNLYRRKEKAVKYAIIFSLLSFFFHLTKSLNFEEAGFSLLIFFLLITIRKGYLVKSEKFNPKQFLSNILIALFCIILYGIAGFWLLDKREFGLNFSFYDSITRTFKQILFIPDPNLIAKTRYAAFFLDSLRWAAILLAVSAISSLFAPIAFKFADNINKKHKAKKLLEKYGASALDYFKIWPDKSYFLPENKNAFISYGVSSDVAISLGDPVGPKSAVKNTIREFCAYCQKNGWKYGFYQVLPDYLRLYKSLNLKSFKVGDEAIVNLIRFDLKGKQGKKFRQTVNKLETRGFSTEYIQSPIPSNVILEAKSVSDDWLKIAGKRERTFTLGYFEKSYLSRTPLFVVKNNQDKLSAFANIIPSYRPQEATVDLMRHKRNAPNGTMDYLFIKLFLFLKELGYKRFSLGLVPMSGFSVKEKATITERAVHDFAQNTNFLFNFKGIKQYKAKYADNWEPRYLIYKNIIHLPFIAKALSQLPVYSKNQ